MSVARRLVGSFGASVLGPLITVLVQFVNVPVMLQAWGPELFGEWLVISAVPIYLLLSDLGFGNVAGSDMTMRVNAGDKDGALETFHSTQALVLLTTAAIITVLAVALTFVPLQRFLHFSALSPAETRTTLLLLFLNTLVVLQWNVIMPAYRCTGRYAAGMLYVNLIRMVEGASVLVLLFFHARPPQLAGLMLCTSILGTAWLMFQHTRVNPWLTFGLRGARYVRVKELSGPAFAFMAFPAGNALSTQGMTLLVSALLGPLAIALFNPMRTLSRVVLQLSNAVQNAVWPELSAAFGKDDWALARKLHRSAFQAAFGLAFLTSVPLVLAGPRFFAFWTHGRIAMDIPAFHLLLLSALVYAGWSASSAVPLAANKHAQVAALYLASCVASLGLAALLVPHIGLRGAAAAALCADVAMSAYVLRKSNRFLSDSWSGFFASLVDFRHLPLLRKRK